MKNDWRESECLNVSYLEFRESPSKAFVLSVEEHFSWGSIADRLLAAAATATPRPVALDMVLDLVMPRALGEVGVLESEAELEALEDELEVRPPVLGRDGVVADMRDSLLALMVAESTVFCRLKLEVVVWLLLVDMAATAEGGPANRRKLQRASDLSLRQLIWKEIKSNRNIVFWIKFGRRKL